MALRRHLGSDRRIGELADRLVLPPLDGVFGDDDVAGLPEPVDRYLRASIAPGTPLARSARITMIGRIKLGRWIPFRAEETLTPSAGFVWAGSAAGVLRGSDSYVDGVGRMDWRLLGIVPVARAAGPDIDLSAAGRCVGESAWLPTSLVRRAVVRWAAEDDRHLVVTVPLSGAEHHIHIEVDGAGRLRSATYDRWGDPSNEGRFGWHPFGMEATAHATFGGMTIPSAGRVGWYHGTDRWSDGEFFRYEITDLVPLGAVPGSGGPS